MDGVEVLVADDDSFVQMSLAGQDVEPLVDEFWFYFVHKAEMPELLYLKADKVYNSEKKVLKAKAFPVKVVETHNDDGTFKVEKYRWAKPEKRKAEKANLPSDEPAQKRRKLHKVWLGETSFDGVARDQLFAPLQGLATA